MKDALLTRTHGKSGSICNRPSFVGPTNTHDRAATRKLAS